MARFLKDVGLSAFDADRRFDNYSGGMKRKLSLACNMIEEAINHPFCP